MWPYVKLLCRLVQAFRLPHLYGRIIQVFFATLRQRLTQTSFSRVRCTALTLLHTATPDLYDTDSFVVSGAAV